MEIKGNKCWEHFEHEADIGVRGCGPTAADAFEQAAIAMTAVITDPANINPVEEADIECEGPDMELLLPDWLNAILFEMSTRGMLFGEFKVRFNEGKLFGTAKGERVDIERHRPTVEVKAATYTALKVTQQQDGTWLAQCVVDV